MSKPSLVLALALALALAPFLMTLHAGRVLAGEVAPPACPPGAADATSPWPDREASIRRHGHLPDACLKGMVRQCADAAENGLLDGDSAAICSVRYEALLRHGFRGDFEALLAWWQRAPVRPGSSP